MNEAKHTPGPWRKSGVIIKGANGEAVCFLSQRNDDHRKPGEELEANGHMIAAAPKLLEACEAYVELFRSSDMRPEDECRELLSVMREAIAEAKGDL